MKPIHIFLSVTAILTSCHFSSPQNKIQEYKSEIIQTEKEFENMVADSGLPVAFSHFVADNGVINRHDSLFHGPAAVKKFYHDQTITVISLKWSPEFVDVSSSGDLGYSYGKYDISFRDPAGALSQHHGIFHTVWKRQPDGSWKFVWD